LYGAILRLRSFLRECDICQAQVKNERHEISHQHRLPSSFISENVRGLAA
jgi:hypothetical protein